MSDDPDVNQEAHEASNVRSIADAPKKPKPERPKKERKVEGQNSPKDADLYEAIFAAITDAPHRLLPQPQFKIETIEVTDGVKTPVLVSETEICKPISMKSIAGLIMAYTRVDLAGNEFYRFTAKDCKDCAEYWEFASTPRSNPPHVRFGSDPGLCWNRVPFELMPGATPVFDEMFSRMSNGSAVKAFIGSLFILESYRQQYLWIYGQGNDGKSSLLEFLARIFGRQGALPQSRAPGGEHWAEAYPGKRLVYFADFKDDTDSLDRGPLKQITGGDRITVNPKHKTPYMAELICKLVFSSNHMPNMDLTQKSNIRRLIFAEMSSTTEFDPEYGDKLWSEGGAFLRSCIEMYMATCPKNRPIPIDSQSLDKIELWGARGDDEYQAWFDTCLIHDPSSRITPQQMSKCIALQYKSKSQIDAVYQWLMRKGYEKKRGTSRADRLNYYPNLAINRANPYLSATL